MTRGTLLILAVAVAAILSVGASAAAAAPERASVQRATDALVAAGAPGVIVLVRDGKRTTRVVAGCANLATRRPIRACTAKSACRPTRTRRGPDDADQARA